MTQTEFANILDGAFRTLDEEEAAIRAAFAKARDRIHEHIVELVRGRSVPEIGGDGLRLRQAADR
jgi:hypothetical protein